MNDGIKFSVFGSSLAFASGTDWKVVACLCGTAVLLGIIEGYCIHCKSKSDKV